MTDDDSKAPGPAAMSLDKEDTPVPDPDPVSEVETPRDAVFLTELQGVRAQLKAMNKVQAQMLANSFLLTAMVCITAYYLMRKSATGG